MTYKRTMQKKHGILQQKDCNCTVQSAHSANPCLSYCEHTDFPSLAMVYGVMQCWRDIDDGCEGFERGTIFGELNKPFMGDKCKNGGCRR